MRGLKYIGSLHDHSGYGEAARNYVLALHRAGVPLTIEARRFEPNPPLVGTTTERAILSSLEGRDIEYDVIIIHLTPDLAPEYIRKYPGKYIISYTVWETSKLPPLWVAACNSVSEVWVPSQWNVDVFRASGVTVPIYKIHHGIDPTVYDRVDVSLSPLPPNDSVFTFYSVMQWNARKNPEGLLRSYFNAFSPTEDVRLLLKAYTGRGVSPRDDATLLKRAIQGIKDDMQLPAYPRLSLITDSLSSDQMKALHLVGDAYVSLTHGEGFGLVSFEAGLAGNPIIATGAGGNMEYMTPENSFPVDYMWDYVRDMSKFNPWYHGDQQWAYPSLIDAAEKMRYVFENYDAAKETAVALQERIKKEFAWEEVASRMVERLKELQIWL